jgi:hypothetical protein
MADPKKWGIRVHDSGWMVTGDWKPAVYYKKSEAVKDANDFNSLRKKSDGIIYTVKEYKK